MNPHMLKRLFKNPSAETIRLNAGDYGSGQPEAVAAVPAPRQADVVRFTIPGVPVAKPRQTRADVWKKRPCVMRYRAWADHARASAGTLPDNPFSVSWVAYLPIPKSWSKVAKKMAAGTHHQQKPDRDNLDKALLDSLFKSDCGIAHGVLEKLWDDGNGPRMEVTIR